MAVAEARPRTFDRYPDLFRHLAETELLPTDEESIFKLAAESTVDYIGVGAGAWYVVVRAELREEGEASRLRGAQGNGPYYVFRKQGGTFQLLGKMFGNSYTWGTLNGAPVFTVTTHLSVDQSQTAVYRVVRDGLVQQ
jgi:hypothetical protein